MDFALQASGIPAQSGPRVNIEVLSNSGSGVAVINLSGRLDPTTTALLDERLRSLHAEGYSCFVLGCADLSYLSSAGIKILLGLRKLLTQRVPPGSIHIAAAKPHVFDVLVLSGLETCFTMYPTLEAARAATA